MNKQNLNITLVTWLGDYNFGTVLQSFALYQKLKCLGYSVKFLECRSVAKSLKNFIKSFLDTFHLYDFIELCQKKGTARKNRIIQRHYMDLVRVFSKKSDQKLIGQTDVFLTGSDQIWNTWYCYNPNMFLDFAENRKRIAYASSLGTNTITEKFAPIIKEHLLRFKHIGVREKTAADLLNELLGTTKVQQVLDPTFLLNAAEWAQFISNSNYGNHNEDKKYIFCYLIGNQKRYKEQIKEIKNKIGISRIIVVPSAENPNFRIDGAEVIQDCDALQFLSFLKGSSYVCTDSFHATALSINFNKEFVVLKRFDDNDPKSQNSRLNDVLSMFGLESRWIDSERWESPIVYSNVSEILERERSRSLEFLVKSIEQ